MSDKHTVRVLIFCNFAFGYCNIFSRAKTSYMSRSNITNNCNIRKCVFRNKFYFT